MKTFFVQERTLPEAYHAALWRLWGCPDRECTMLINVQEPLAEPMITKLGLFDAEALEQYRQEILDGILDFEVKRGNWHYTYHQRMAEWKQGVIDELKRDPVSRRAVIAIRDNGADMMNENPACLQTLQYMIRDGKLSCWVVMRSNDAVQASFMNMFAFIMLQKEFAEALGVEVGEYTHYATNFHCYPGYEEEWLDRWVTRYVRSLWKYRVGAGDVLAYPYKGCWDALMEEAKPKIAAKVQEQYKKYQAERKSCANCGRECKVKEDPNAEQFSCFDWVREEK